MSTAQTTTWYVRVQGHVRGPFPVTRLRQLRDQARLDPNTEISEDRTVWIRAGSLTELYPPGSVPDDKPKGPREKDWFYQQNGQQIGAVPLSTLQLMASSGRLEPHELVWAEGFSTWIPASQVPELGFLQRKPRGLASLSGRYKLGLLVAASCLFLAPACFVFQSNAERLSSERREAEERRADVLRLAREKTEKERFEAELAERQALREAIESQNARIKQIAKSESSSTSQSLKYPVGTRVANKGFGFFSKGFWTGRVSGYAKGVYEVKISTSKSGMDSRYKPGATIAMFEDEMQEDPNPIINGTVNVLSQ